MPTITPKYFGQHNATDPAATESRTEGAANFNGLGGSLQLQFPNLTGAVNTGQDDLNNVAVKNKANTFTDTNTFEQDTTFDRQIALTRSAGVQNIAKTGGTNLNIDQESGQEIRFRMGGSTVLTITDAGATITGTFGADAYGNISATDVNTGALTVTGLSTLDAVDAASVSATGAVDGLNVTATNYVRTVRFRIESPTVGPVGGAQTQKIRCDDVNGVLLGYVPLYTA